MADQKEKKVAEQKEKKTALTYEDLNFRNTVIDRLSKKWDGPEGTKKTLSTMKSRVANAAKLKGVAGLKTLGSSSTPKI